MKVLHTDLHNVFKKAQLAVSDPHYAWLSCVCNKSVCAVLLHGRETWLIRVENVHRLSFFNISVSVALFAFCKFIVYAVNLKVKMPLVSKVVLWMIWFWYIIWGGQVTFTVQLLGVGLNVSYLQMLGKIGRSGVWVNQWHAIVGWKSYALIQLLRVSHGF